MAGDAGSTRSDATNGLKVAAGGLCVVAVLFVLAYLAAPKVVAGIILHALAPVAQLWPGAH